MTQTPYCVNQIAGDVFVANGYGECKAPQPFQKLKKKKRIDLPILLSGFATGIPLNNKSVRGNGNTSWPSLRYIYPVGRPIISGCEGPTERISSFVDSLLQPIAKQQTSYLKDTTDFINFLEKTKVEENTVLVSMDVTSLYTNIPQEEGITTVCNAYENFHRNKPPIPTHFLKEMLRHPTGEFVSV